METYMTSFEDVGSDAGWDRYMSTISSSFGRSDSLFFGSPPDGDYVLGAHSFADSWSPGTSGFISPPIAVSGGGTFSISGLFLGAISLSPMPPGDEWLMGGVRFFDENGDFLSEEFQTPFLAPWQSSDGLIFMDGWQLLEHSGRIPEGAHSMRALYRFDHLGGSSVGYIYLDNVVIEWTEPLPPSLLLHVEPKGFRFPYQDWDTDEAVEKNMKYLEFQLEKFLHWHHVNEEIPPVVVT